MKAACVLVCLALAHGISGTIFKQQGRRVDNLDVQPLEYNDQYQQQDQYSSWENQKQTVKSKKIREQPQSQKHRETQLQNQKYLDQQTKGQIYQEDAELPQMSQYQQRLPTYLRDQYQLPSTVNAQDWPFPIHVHPQHPQHRRSEKTHRQVSSSESSQETREKQYYENQEPTLRDVNQKWITPLVNTVMNMDNQKPRQVYGDAIVWNGLQMAVGPNSPVSSPEDIAKIFGDAQKAMKHIEEADKVKFHEVYEVAKQEVNEESLLNATELAQKHQYPIEEYTLRTDDGYILTVFRIPPKTQIRDVQKRPVVFLMHGILGSADDWLLMGPGKALAYLLSDAGYDVWLGNARGNKYSRRHVSKNPAVFDFWQFSIDEIALHDLPAMIDFALETTKQEKLYYIGHALGTTAFFALTATLPEYNNKIIMMYALSPMVYMTNVRSPLFRMMASTSTFSDRLKHLIGNAAFNPNKELIHTIGGAMCEKEIGCKMVCANVNFVMAGVNVDGMDPNIIPLVLSHLPAGSSSKLIKQYGQGVASKEFRRYDYGPHMNQQVYGKPEATMYNITEVQVPVTLYYSEEDWLAHPTDVVRLQEALPNVKEAYKVPVEHFSHMDFQFSTQAPEMVYKRLIDSMQNNQ